MKASRKQSYKKKKMVNLVIKDHVIRYVDAKKPSLYGPMAFGEYRLAPDIVREGKIAEPDRLRLILKDCVRRWNISNREVQFVIPDPFVIVRKFDIPPHVADEEIKAYLYLELGSRIHLPFEDPIFDFDFLETNEEKKEILLFAAPEHIVAQYAQLLESAALKPVAADISPLAVYRLFYQAGKEPGFELPVEAPTLSVQFDLHTVTASIFHKHKLLLVRQFKMNLSADSWETSVDRTGALTTVWNGDLTHLQYEVKVIMEEIQRFINFYYASIDQGDDEIETIVLTGDYPYLDNIAEHLQQHFGKVPFTFSGHWSETQPQELFSPKYYLALGLSLKGGA